ncbi:lycopene beta-cyclase CrtY [Phenylobacterium sp.]|jgi:lycopene beta-cyclase|uniref:lycopene beta-cyclase CrtY n=1 Tax=Phenylobacterium sp. TaxID=1871053 RepID=UPI002F94681E
MLQRAPTYDVLLVGGGLANSLIALELRRRHPDLRVAVLDPAPEPEPHTWCLFETDTTPSHWTDLAPRLDHVWRGYEVGFPAHARGLSTTYGCLTSPTLRAAVRKALGPDLLRGEARHLAPDAVVLADGQTLHAPLVIDGRGPSPSPHLDIRFQKFLGLELQLKRPHGLDRPTVMDATVRQTDGFRFFYVLPLGPDRLLIEDTRYSEQPGFDRLHLEAEILRYARGAGWSVAGVTRREQGALPVALGGDVDAYWEEPGRRIPQVGLRGLFFHPVTGYSFPDALEVADLVTRNARLDTAGLGRVLRDHSVRLWRRRGFYRLLNRMLFTAARPEQRYRVLERFYRLPEPLIERFYAGRSTFGDMVQVLSGRPPVPLWPALKAVAPRRRPELA